jgi:hypothetical protein
MTRKMLFAAIVLSALISLGACREERVAGDDGQAIDWPVAPPKGPSQSRADGGTEMAAAISRYAKSAAGSKAVDCGVAVDERTLQTIYDCAEKSFRADQAFVAMLARPRQPEIAFGDRPGLPGWASPWTAVFSTGDGVLHQVQMDPAGTVRSAILFFKHGDTHVFHAGGLVTRPLLIGSSPVVTGSSPEIDGLIILECRISATGIVDQASVLKPLAGDVNDLALQLVKRVRFHPGTVLGYPATVVYNLTIEVRDGQLRITPPAG